MRMSSSPDNEMTVVTPNARKAGEIMLINGYSDFEGVRKVAQKDGLSTKKAQAQASASTGTPLASDQADLSSSSRMYQMKDVAKTKLEQIPDPRDEKIREALDAMERGSLMTPAAVKESIGKMVDKGMMPWSSRQQ